MASFNYFPSRINMNQRIATPIMSNNIAITRHIPLRNMTTLNSPVSLSVSSNAAASALSGSPVVLTLFNVSGNDLAILSDLGELPTVLTSIESMKNGVSILCSCAAEGDAVGMNRAANEEVLPHMRSANIIDRKFLETNSLVVDIAAIFLQELRLAQLELMRGARQQIETIAKIPADEITENEISALAEAVQIASETAEQVAVTDQNESSFSEELWEKMWAVTSRNYIEEYESVKHKIEQEIEKIDFAIKEICKEFGDTSGTTQATESFPNNERSRAAQADKYIIKNVSLSSYDSGLKILRLIRYYFALLDLIREEEIESRKDKEGERVDAERQRKQKTEENLRAIVKKKRLALKEIHLKQAIIFVSLFKSLIAVLIRQKANWQNSHDLQKEESFLQVLLARFKQQAARPPIAQ